MSFLLIYLITGQAAWLLGQFKNPFCHTSNYLKALFFISWENSHVSSVKAVCLSQRKWAERTFTWTQCKILVLFFFQLVKFSELCAVIMIWNEVFPFPSVTAHLLPVVTSVSSHRFGMVVLPPTVPEHCSGSRACLTQCTVTHWGEREEGHGRNKGFKDDRCNTKKRDCSSWRNCQLSTTWILFKSCLLVVPKRRKPGSSVENKSVNPFLNKPTKLYPEIQSRDLNCSRSPRIEVPTEVRENLLTVNSTSHSHCWWWLRYWERKFSVFWKIHWKWLVFCKMFFQWRRWETVWRVIQNSRGENCPLISGVCRLFSFCFPPCFPMFLHYLR